MKKIIIIVLVVFIVIVQSSYSQISYKKEISTGIGLNFTSFQESTLMELSFSYQMPNKGNNAYRRFRGEIGIPYDPEEEWIQSLDNNKIATNIFHRNPKLLLKYGKGKVEQLGWGEYYYGIDGNLGWSYLKNKHYYSELPYVPDAPNNMYDYKSINQNILLGMTPVSGLKIYLSKHFILSIEAGLEFNYQYARVPVFDGEMTTYRHRHYFETSWRDRFILNDIMISYRF